MLHMNEFMKIAIEEAFCGMRTNSGGPFGAVIVKDGKIIARGHNEVTGTNDPTAHAEITVIRKASAALGRFDLSGCDIYSSCEPCPMCFSAIFWSRISRLCFASTREDAGKIGFDDKLLYDILAGKAENTQFETVRLADHEYENRSPNGL
jgi:guanine deaminase